MLEALRDISADSFLLDGEIVALDEEGRPDFQLLQGRINRRGRERSGESTVPVVYFVFDLLACEGYDLRGVTLAERRKVLRALLPDGPLLRFTQAVTGPGEEFFRLACERGLEGIVAKDQTSTYVSRRARSWLKIKCFQQQEFVIGGFTPPSGSRRYFGALLVGLYEGKRLHYAGRVGSGFDQITLKELHGRLQKLKTPTPPFDPPPELPGATWVRPRLVAEVRFSEWTRDRQLRAPIFLGLRADVEPTECRLETPSPNAGNNPNAPAELPYEFLSNLDKLFWPDSGYTKGDLVLYYHQVAEFILPYLKDRPMVMERFPDGMEGKSFYQKEAPDFLPDWVATFPVESESRAKKIPYILCNDRRTLVYLANLACISMHPWSSRIEHLDRPDFLIIDLDPSEGVPFPLVTRLALKVRQIFEQLELLSYPKTSGAKGMHILVPLRPQYDYEQVRQFAEIVARMVVDGLGELATIERSPARRKGKIYVDFLQNGRGKTIASPYSVRPRPGATVSTPLRWEEVNARLRPQAFHIKSIFRRLENKGDAWEGFWDHRHSLQEALLRLERLWRER